MNTQAPLVAFLSAHIPLRHLYLNNNGLGPIAGVLVADALSSLAEKKEAARKAGKDVPNLETVICGRNRLENGSMASWAKAYSLHKGVKEIKMVQNGIRQEGITHLIREGLSHLSDLEVLDLQDNTFTTTGAGALSDVIGGWSSLRELAINDCYLTARGGLKLGKALDAGKNKNLEVLRLQFNEFKANVVKALADAQGSLPKLRRIELNGNIFSEDDENIERIRETLDERKEKADDAPEDAPEDYWGLDELDELEEESDEEEGDEGSGDESDAPDEAEEEAKEIEKDNTDKKVDALADELAKKAEIK